MSHNPAVLIVYGWLIVFVLYVGWLFWRSL